MLKCTINKKKLAEQEICHYEKEHAISRKQMFILLDVIFLFLFFIFLLDLIFNFNLSHIYIHLQPWFFIFVKRYECCFSVLCRLNNNPTFLILFIVPWVRFARQKNMFAVCQINFANFTAQLLFFSLPFTPQHGSIFDGYFLD